MIFPHQPFKNVQVIPTSQTMEKQALDCLHLNTWVVTFQPAFYFKGEYKMMAQCFWLTYCTNQVKFLISSSPLKTGGLNWAQRHIPIIPATWEVEADRLQVQG